MTGQRRDQHRRRAAGDDLRAGLVGALDLPVDVIDDPTRVDVSGWVFHPDAEVLLVAVVVDGRVVGTADVEIARPDVIERYDAAPPWCGWGTTINLGRTDGPVTMSVQALLAPPGADGQPRGIVVLDVTERVLEVAGPGVVSGETDLPDRANGPTLDVTGVVDIHPALARVEVTVGDAPPVRARHSLPSGTERGLGPEGRLRAFSAVVELPADADRVDVQVSALATDGTRAALPTTSVELARPEPDAGTDRGRVLLDRFEQHVGALRAVFPGPSGRRVLVAAHDLGIGGAQGYLDDLMRGLSEAGLEMCVVAGADGPLRERIETDYGAPVLVLGPPPTDLDRLETHLRLIAGFALEHGAAACVANTLVTFPAVLAAQRLGIPSTWAIHESFAPAVFWHEYLRAPADPAVLAGTHEALASCDEVLFEAESTRRVYAGLVPDERAALVPYGLDIASVDAALAATSRERARHELDIPVARRVLVCVGSVEPRKGQLALARAFSRLDAGARAVTSLYLVGATDNLYSRALRTFVEDAGLDEVHVVDADPEIVRWYAAADVLVSASDVESMPRTMLEAMLAGRPVAATAAFGVAELVEDGVSGWLCEPGDLRELTGLLSRAARASQTDVDRMGAAARERVVSDHSARGYVEHVQGRLEQWLDVAGSAQ